jgi:hypothetical protein
MKCKHGDLAIIIQDFKGCEGNLGVIVRVIGPAIKHPATSMPCWEIKPVKRRKLWLAGDGPVTSEFISKDNPAYHPDPWMLPIKGEPVINKRQKNRHLTSSNQ